MPTQNHASINTLVWAALFRNCKPLWEIEYQWCHRNLTDIVCACRLISFPCISVHFVQSYFHHRFTFHSFHNSFINFLGEEGWRQFNVDGEWGVAYPNLQAHILFLGSMFKKTISIFRDFVVIMNQFSEYFPEFVMWTSENCDSACKSFTVSVKLEHRTAHDSADWFTVSPEESAFFGTCLEDNMANMEKGQPSTSAKEDSIAARMPTTAEKKVFGALLRHKKLRDWKYIIITNVTWGLNELFNAWGTGPLIVLVSPCYRENVVVTYKIGSFFV